MDTIVGSDSTFPRAPFNCECCSRPLVIVDDAAEQLWKDVSPGQQDTQRLLPRDEGVVGVSAPRVQEADELLSSTGDAFVVLPPVGDCPRAKPHTPRQSSTESRKPLPLSSTHPIAVEPVAARIKRVVREAASGDGWTVLHPLCYSCLDAAIAQLEPASAHEKRLIRKYEKALRRLERSSRPPEFASPAVDDTNAATAELQKLEEEEKRLLHDISFLESFTAQKENDQLEVMADLAELYMWHVEFWLLFSNHSLRAMRHEERKRAMERLFAYISQELQRLKRINVVSDAFHIWTSKFLPSINNCRIGRVSSPSCPSWSEVNTGWGYLCLLLDVFYRKCRTQPSDYRLVPRGQFSFLVRKKDGIVLPLHGGGGEAGLSRFFYSNKRFDAAMTSFLECVKELFDRLLKSAHEQQRAHSLLPIPELPYEIDGDRVGGFSIRLQLNQDERWTKALKHLLIDLKWMLEYIERVSLITGSAP